MKKAAISLFLIAAFLITLCPFSFGSSPLFTFTDEVGLITSANSTPTIDGDISASDGWGSGKSIDCKNYYNYYSDYAGENISADVYFAWDESGFYFAADITDSEVIPSSAANVRDVKPDGFSDYGWNGDSFILALDPLSLFTNDGWLGSDDYNAWYSATLFADGSAHLCRTKYDYSDLTDSVDISGKVTESGWRIECRIPWEQIITDVDIASFGILAAQKDALAAENTVSKAAVIFADRNTDEEKGIVVTHGCYMTCPDIATGGFTPEMLTTFSIMSYGITLVTADENGEFDIAVDSQEQDPQWTNPYNDVKENDWFYDAAEKAYRKGIFSGVLPDSFAPNSTMTRAMFVTAVGRYDGINTDDYSDVSYSDVEAGSWYAPYVDWASDNNIVNGVGDAKFDPSANVTREQMITLLYRYVKYRKYRTDGVDASLARGYNDYSDCGDWSASEMEWAISAGIVSGFEDNTLRPQNNATRAEAAKLITGFIDAPFNRFMKSGEKVESLTICGRDISEFSVIYSEGYEDIANILADYIYKTVNITLPVLKDDSAPAECEILIGETDRENGSVIIDRTNLVNNSYLIKSEGYKVFLTGGGKNGTGFAVYGFLEDCLGWRFTYDDISYTMSGKDKRSIGSVCHESLYYAESIELTELDIFKNADIDYFVLFQDSTESKIKEMNKLNLESKLEKDDYYYHSIYYFLDPDGDSMDRLSPMPCLNDPTNRQTIITNAIKRLDENPNLDILNVCQNDNSYYCTCATCRQVYREEGSRAGCMLRLVNEIADIVAEKYPDRFVAFMPYEYSIRPTNTHPRDNVIITPCTIDMCYHHGFVDDYPTANVVYESILGWASIAKHIYMYDHLAQGFSYLTTNANFSGLYRNAKVFDEVGVNGYFYIGADGSGEFGDLRVYLLSLFIWDDYTTYSEYDIRIEEYLESVYGDGWKNVKNYIEFMEKYSQTVHYQHNPYITSSTFSQEIFMENADYLRSLWDNTVAASDKSDAGLVKRIDISMTQFEFMYQCFSFESRYRNGSAVDKAAYVSDNQSLFAKMTKYWLAMNEKSNMPPESVNFEASPDTWSPS